MGSYLQELLLEGSRVLELNPESTSCGGEGGAAHGTCEGSWLQMEANSEPEATGGVLTEGPVSGDSWLKLRRQQLTLEAKRLELPPFRLHNRKGASTGFSSVVGWPIFPSNLPPSSPQMSNITESMEDSKC